jgi:hypothetical protein
MIGQHNNGVYTKIRFATRAGIAGGGSFRRKGAVKRGINGVNGGK